MIILNTAGYFFGPLPKSELANYKTTLLEWCNKATLRGTILVTTEGLNIMLAGPANSIKTVEMQISTLVNSEILFKHSESADYPFKRMLVKIKKEVITFGAPTPNESAPFIEPSTLKRWLDQGCDDYNRPLLLVDTRNDYEVSVGTFKNSIDLNIPIFSAFPEAVRTLDAKLFENKAVVTFCTGGIRCEKAAPFLQSLKIADPVYQLKGGILNYLNLYNDTHWVGECFVFDERIVVEKN